MKLFVDLNRQGTTILLVTHNSDIAAYGNRLIEMKDGRIIGDTKRASPVAARSV
jgi:ABC-type lipoprotein export system ATPase subunit